MLTDGHSSYGKKCMIDKTNIMIGPKMGARPNLFCT